MSRGLPVVDLGKPVAAVVVVRLGEERPNVARVKSDEIVEGFAAELARAGLFSRVIQPQAELGGVEPGWVLELSVASHHDRHRWRNLAKDLAAGASLLLLQPLLPTTYDLWLELSLRVLDGEGRLIARRRQVTCFRFEYDWLHPPTQAVEEWHARAKQHAIRRLVDRLRVEGERLAAAPVAESWLP